MINMNNEISRLEDQLKGLGVDVSAYGRGAGDVPESGPPVWSDSPDPIRVPICGEPMAMPMEVVPKVIADYATEIARVFSVPVEYAVVPALIYAASLIGSKVRVKGGDKWFVPCTLWGYVVGLPGMKKNAAGREMYRPIGWLESKWREEHEQNLSEFKTDEQLWVVKKMRLEKDLKSANDMVARDIADQIANGAPIKPVQRRLSVGDVTTEKLVMLLQDNQYLLLNLDELRQMFQAMSKKGYETLRTLLLTASDGTGTVHVDRVGRESDHVEEPLMSIFGTMQDDVAQTCLTDGAADGFSERFQIGVWPSVGTEYVEPDAPISEVVETEYFRRMLSLEYLDPVQVDAAPHERGFHFLDLDDVACALFKAWRWYVETAIRMPELRTRSRLSSVLGKSSGLPLKLALIDHLLSGRIGPITASEVERGIVLSCVFFSHAEKIFADAVARELPPAHVLLADLLKKDRTELFIPRDIYRRDRAGLDQSSVESACLELVKMGWLSSEVINTKGRPSIRYRVNPSLHSTPFVGFVGSFFGNTLTKVLRRALDRTSVGSDGYICIYLFNMDYYYIYTKEPHKASHLGTHVPESEPTKPTKESEYKQSILSEYPEEWDNV